MAQVQPGPFLGRRCSHGAEGACRSLRALHSRSEQCPVLIKALVKPTSKTENPLRELRFQGENAKHPGAAAGPPPPLRQPMEGPEAVGASVPSPQTQLESRRQDGLRGQKGPGEEQGCREPAVPVVPVTLLWPQTGAWSSLNLGFFHCRVGPRLGHTPGTVLVPELRGSLSLNS